MVYPPSNPRWPFRTHSLIISLTTWHNLTPTWYNTILEGHKIKIPSPKLQKKNSPQQSKSGGGTHLLQYSWLFNSLVPSTSGQAVPYLPRTIDSRLPSRNNTAFISFLNQILAFFSLRSGHPSTSSRPVIIPFGTLLNLGMLGRCGRDWCPQPNANTPASGRKNVGSTKGFLVWSAAARMRPRWKVPVSFTLVVTLYVGWHYLSSTVIASFLESVQWTYVTDLLGETRKCIIIQNVVYLCKCGCVQTWRIGSLGNVINIGNYVPE